MSLKVKLHRRPHPHPEGHSGLTTNTIIAGRVRNASAAFPVSRPILSVRHSDSSIGPDCMGWVGNGEDR